MEDISKLRIIGVDPTRPPTIRKEPYIELFFKLIEKAPKKWCEDFNQLVSKGRYPVKIDPKEGLFIETWVREADEIAIVVNKLKKAVKECNEQYISRIEEEKAAQLSREKTLSGETEGEQGQLNRLIASLNFDEE